MGSLVLSVPLTVDYKLALGAKPLPPGYFCQGILSWQQTELRQWLIL